jgi:hypothetical protein
MPQSFKQSYATTRDSTRARIQAYLNRRPHRSFQLTRRRDYVRELALPGYFTFNIEVFRTLWADRKLFLGLAIVYGLLTTALVGIGSQEAYTAITTTLRDTSSNILQGQLGQIGQAGILFASIATSGLTGTLTDIQQIYTAILLLFVWVTTVWLLRQLLANRKVKLRDALYNAGSPIVATLLLSGLLLVQMIPLALAVIGYSAATSSGLINSGVEAMLFWAAALFLTILSIYWLISTFFAMVIVTLPGTYPMQALRTAGDIVTGRRMKMFLRIIWMLVSIAVVWALILIPLIVIDGAIKSALPGLENVPIVPVALLVIGTLTVIWSATYVYLLYRKVVEYDAAQ